MNTFGGFLILFSFLVFGIAAWEGLTGVEDAGSTGLVGLFFLILGYVLATRTPGRSAVETLAEQAAEKVGETLSDFIPAASEAEPAEAVFSVSQTGDNDVLDRVDRLLEKDKRVRTVVAESGRWHQTPDDEDLPEWFALRVYCLAGEVDQVMTDTETRIRSELGEAAARKVSIRRFS